MNKERSCEQSPQDPRPHGAASGVDGAGDGKGAEALSHQGGLPGAAEVRRADGGEENTWIIQ